MKKLFPSLLLLLILIGCGPRFTNKYDVSKERAELPQEEAPHERNSLEWWYLTGHLKDKENGKSYGVEYVFFHFNPTGKKDYMMVNVALSDPQTQQFHYDYNYAKLPKLLPADLPVNLALRKQNQQWTLTGQEGRYHLQARMVSHPGTAINLTTKPAKAVLMHGGTGYDRNVAMNKVGYYTYPRLTATGTIEVDGKPRQVEGELWYDRQWNCNMSGTKDVSWDWFSIQLDEPREELMIYNLEHKPTGKKLGGGSHFSAAADNTHLDQTDFQVEPLAYWTSPTSGLRYPAKWRVRVPSKGYDLIVEPLIPNQELRIHFYAIFNLYYWEGMCRVTGTHNGQPVTGNSYVEITNRREVKKAKQVVETATLK
ncbi:MAG TPA: lipocalin family protein [Hymenobacter sp.]|jgi:predicted secreted hydrolase